MNYSSLTRNGGGSVGGGKKAVTSAIISGKVREIERVMKAG